MFYKYPFINGILPDVASFDYRSTGRPVGEEDPFQALASPDDLEEMGDQPPPPNTARILDGTMKLIRGFFFG